MNHLVQPWIIKEVDIGNSSSCMMFSACSWRLNLVANHDITQSSKPARLAIIRLIILVQKLIHMTTAFYDEISEYSRSTLANISSIKELKMHPKFRLNQRYFLGRHFRSYNSYKIPKQRRKTFTSNTFCGIGRMFVKQLDQFWLLYYCLHAENITN